MTVFLCEDSVCGILTGVYDAWDSRLGHANVKLALKKGYQPELFTDCQEVGPDAEKANKVLRTLDRKMYLEDFEALYQALLSADDQKADDREKAHPCTGASDHLSHFPNGEKNWEGGRALL